MTYTQAEVKEALQTIFVDKASIFQDDYTPSANIREDFDVDSLDIIEIRMEIEDKFHIQISDEELNQIQTVRDMETCVFGKCGAA